jgi:hypothetical protein
LSFTAAFVVTGGISSLAALVWLRASETLPRPADSTAEQIAAECGCLDEGPEVPTGQRVAGRPRHPDA